MWLGWEPVVKITVPLEWTLFTVINAVAWGSQQRAQLLQRPWWCCRFPSSLWVTSISNTEIRAQLYICFVSGGHTIQHSLLPALRYNFFYLFEYICWKEKAADQKLLFCLRHTPARFFHMCVTHYIIYCLYLLITLLHECIQWCNTHKKVSQIQGACICTCRGMWPAIDSLRISSATVAGCKHDFIKSRNKGWGLVFCVSFIFQYVYTSDWICTDFVIHSHTIPPQLPHLCPSTSETA